MKSYRRNYIDNVEEMNEILGKLKYSIEVPSIKSARVNRFYIDFKNIEFKVYTTLFENHKKGDVLPQCYIFRMDGSKASEHATRGVQAFRTLQRMSGNFIFDYAKDEYKGIFWDEWDDSKGKPIWDVGYESPLLMFNNDYGFEYEIDNCYSYDVNSSYAYAMLSDMPDCKQGYYIRKIGEMRKVQSDEIGFTNIEGRLMVIESGRVADYIFKRVKSPFKKFVETYYEQKKNAKTKLEKQKFKDMLNYAVGYILRKNPFIHACILGNARKYIEQFIDKDTLYSNTDSIVSRVKRPDLEALLGDNVGQFKNDHLGTFRRKNGAYQWVGEKPVARGISKMWFKEDFNLLIDDMPNNDYNMYYFDRRNMLIKRNED